MVGSTSVGEVAGSVTPVPDPVIPSVGDGTRGDSVGEGEVSGVAAVVGSGETSEAGTDGVGSTGEVAGDSVASGVLVGGAVGDSVGDNSRAVVIPTRIPEVGRTSVGAAEEASVETGGRTVGGRPPVESEATGGKIPLSVGRLIGTTGSVADGRTSGIPPVEPMMNGPTMVVPSVVAAGDWAVLSELGDGCTIVSGTPPEELPFSDGSETLGAVVGPAASGEVG